MPVRKSYIIVFLFFVFLIIACVKENDQQGMPLPKLSQLKMILKFDSTQVRLDNYGNIAIIPTGHEAQSPLSYSVSIKQIELLRDSSADYYAGANYFYNSSATQQLAHEGIAFDEYISSHDAPGTFKWIRVYFGLQNFRIRCKVNGNVVEGSLLSFLKPVNNENEYLINDSTIINDSTMNKGQWFLELDGGISPILAGQVQPESAISQPNSLHYSWPAPSDLYVVTCPINPILSIGRPYYDTVTLSISINKSFEWVEHSDPDYFEPLNGDTIVDFGIRGVQIIQ